MISKKDYNFFILMTCVGGVRVGDEGIGKGKEESEGGRVRKEEMRARTGREVR